MHKTPQKPYKTTREMLELAETIHLKIKRHYAGIADAAAADDAAMLLDYIERKEAAFGALLARYRRQAPRAVLDTYFQFTQNEHRAIQKWMAWQPDADAGVAEILAVALELDAFMQDFYRRAAQMAQVPKVREIFANLAEAVADKKRDAAFNAAQMRDV